MGHITSLPLELHSSTVQHLDFGDKLRLSSTCQHLRALLAPGLFQKIHITNDAAIAESALLAVNKYGMYTTWLQFTGDAGPKDDFSAPALVAAAAHLLGGRHMPHLRTIQIKFDFDFDTSEAWDDNEAAMTDCRSIYLFDVVEDTSYVRKQERQWKWRAIMNEAWQALAAANVTVRELIVDDLIPKWTSAFHTPEFEQFLGRLESASISILGLDDGAGWQINTMDGNLEYLAELDQVFFRHMGQLKNLFLCASELSPIGLTGFRHTPLALKPGHLPVLESLKLQNCFVGPELVRFVRGHAQVLKRLELKDCVSGGDGYGMAEDAIYWNTFLSELQEANLALSELLVDCGGHAPLTDKEEFDHGDVVPGDEEPENIQLIRQKLKDDPRLRVFGYASLDDKYGMWFMDEDQNVERFEQGEDQAAYGRLMAVIKENAGRSLP